MVATRLFSVVLVLILTSAVGGGSSAQRKSRRRSTARPVPQITRDDLVTTSDTGSKGVTEVALKFSLAAAGRSQAFYIGAAFSDSHPNSAVLSILSVSNRYHYESHSSVEILVDGSRLSSREKYDSFRQAGVDNGNAVETLSVSLTLDEFRLMATASRVDVTAWVDRFTLNTSTISALGQFVGKVDLALAKARLKPKATDGHSVSSSGLLREFDPTIETPTVFYRT